MSGSSASQSIIELLIELKDRISEPIERVEEHLEHVHGSFRDLAAAAAEAFIGFEALENLIGPAEEFQKAQVDLAIATNATVEQLEKLHRQADALSTSFPQTAEAITGAQKALAQSLGDVERAMEATSAAVKFATPLHMDAAEAARLLAAVYQQLGDKSKPVGEEFGRIGDKLEFLLTRFPSAGGSADMMAKSFARVAEAARSFGVSIDQSLAAVATLNKLGLGGSRGAGTFVQQIIETLGKLDKNGIPVVHKLGIALVRTSDGGINLIKTLELLAKSPDKLKRLEQSLGTQGEAVALLVEHLQDLRDAREEFANAEGTADAAAAKVNDTYAAAWTEFKNALTDLEVTLGTGLLPMLTEALHVLRDILVSVREFAEAHPVIASFITDFVAVAASIMMIKGALLTALVALRTFSAMGVAMMGPWGILAAAIIAAAVEIYEHWDTLKQWFNEFWAWLAPYIGEAWTHIKPFTDLFMAVAGLIIEAWKPVGEFFKQCWDQLVANFEDGWKKIKPIVDAIRGAVDWIGGKASSAIKAITPGSGTPVQNQSGTLMVPSPDGGMMPAPGLARALPAQSSSTTVQYNGQVTINGADLSDPEKTRAAVEDALRKHADDLSQQQRDNNRVSFGDPAMSTGY